MDDLTGLQLSVIPTFDIGVDQQQQQQQVQAQQQMEKQTNKRKRPMNAFLLFCKDKREETVGQNPSLKSVDISPILGEQWKNLPEAEKEKYKQRAAEQQRQFKEENPDYQYERAKQKHQMMKQKGEPEVKPINVLDVKTLLEMSPEDIKTYMFLISSQTMGQGMQIPETMQQQFNAIPNDQTQYMTHDLTFHQE